MSEQQLPNTAIPRIAVMTGASRGLGKEIANILLEKGFHVITGQRTPQDNTNVNYVGMTNLKALILDMKEPESITTFAEQILDTVPYVDLLINNAGICPTYPLDARHIQQHWETVMQVNFYAQIQLTIHLLPLLQRSVNYARVINVSSGDGEMLFFHEDVQKRLQQLAESENVEEMQLDTQLLLKDLLSGKSLENVDSVIFNGQPAYKLSKAMLNVFTRVGAKTWSSTSQNSVSFMAVCPGDVETNMRDTDCTSTLSPTQAARAMQLIFDVFTPCVWNGQFTRHGQIITW